MLVAGNHVAFYAKLNRDVTNLADDATIVMSDVVTNNGNAYDGHIGTFIAPQTGTYVFMATLLVDRGHHLEAEIVKNGQEFAALYGNADRHWEPTSASAVINLSVGDKVWPRIHSRFHDIAATLNHDFSSFTGFCIDCN